MSFIDLSQTIDVHTPMYPGETPTKLWREKDLHVDGHVAYRLESGLHVATHIDMPMHFVDDARTCADFALDCFVGRGVVLDVRGENPIRRKPHYDGLIRRGDVVLLYTGHDALFKSDPQKYYTQHPIVDMDFVAYLAEKQIKILGVDCCSPDYPPYDAHKVLLARGIFIMENLTNLARLLDLDAFEVFAFPLKIAAEGSFIRAAARATPKNPL